ncbi:MAG: bifunctional glutamate--cysteine ligase GshA/glutathione synthetase GshB [Lactovum sp.]
MMNIIKEIIKETDPTLSFFEMALESESLRIENGLLSEKDHPAVFEPKISHPYITTDFSESQLEWISPVSTKPQLLQDFLKTLYDLTALELDENEYLFPYSLPVKLEEEKIRLANFKSGKVQAESANRYRAYLSQRYGKKKQTLSGIHFNLSLSQKIREDFEKKGIKSNDLYLKIARNYQRYQFLTVALLGASPIADPSFLDEDIGEWLSIRNSHLGYRNLQELDLDYSTTEAFITSLEQLIEKKVIYDEREIYESVRLKTQSKHLLEDLKKDKIKYIEIRNIDINPYEKGGISVSQIEFLRALICYCLIKEEETEISRGRRLSDFIAESSNFQRKVPFENNQTIFDLLLEQLEDMLETFKELGLSTTPITNYIKDLKENNLLYQKLTRDIKEKGYLPFLEELAKAYKKSAYEHRFKLYGHEDLELSTQILIKESLKSGVKVDILDRKANFISLSKDGKTEYVEQATKTSRDNYVTICAMENKVVTKKILENQGYRIPLGSEFEDFEEALDYCQKMSKDFVIKPKSTNFGLGISIFTEKVKKKDISSALKLAFSYDETILIEKFIKGEEYRFLVIDDKLVAILNRIPANILGDGKQTIESLIDEKNQDPLRGEGHRTPLEKIVIDDALKIYLNQQAKNIQTIPAKGERVFLRPNSNISTGGDSIDMTDEMPEYFKNQAVEIVRSFGAKICGLDMIIENYQNPESEYAIIELNFNPAVYLHTYPYKGQERNIAKEILSLLELI